MKDNRILILYMPTADQKILPFPPLGISVIAGYLRRKGIAAYIDDLEMKYWNRDIFNSPTLKKLSRKFPLKYNNPKRIFLNSRIVKEYLSNNRLPHSMSKILADWEACLDANISRLGYVGFSIMSINQLSTSLCFAKYLKQKYGTKTVFGGSFIASSMSGLVEIYPFVDYLIVGEGEMPLARLLSGKQETAINNLIYKDGGRARINSIISEYPDNMEPDFEGLPFGTYRRNKVLFMPYETSKGCINKCAFCITVKKSLFFKKTDTIIEEISTIKKRYMTNFFLFIDNAININKAFSVDLCNAIIKKSLNILWSAYYIPKDEDDEYFRLLRKAGCVQLRWGIETPVPRVLKSMNKDIEPREISSALIKASGAGIWNHLLFVIGYPDEKWSDIFAINSFIRSHKNYFKSSVVAPFDLARIDTAGRRNNSYQNLYCNGRTYEKEAFGIKYRIFKDRNLALKYKLIYYYLRSQGIRFIGNLNKMKDRFEENQFIYNAFSGYLHEKEN